MVSAGQREAANTRAVERMVASEPVLVGVKPALEVIPGMAANMVLTSGPPHAFEDYDDGQRDAVVYGALFEGLAGDYDQAVQKFRAGEIVVEACQEHGCIGSLAGIYTASMPVFVVENAANGNRGFCNFYEGESHRRLNYGCWGEDVRRNLMFIEEVLAPVIGEAVRRLGGVPLKPIMRRAAGSRAPTPPWRASCSRATRRRTPPGWAVRASSTRRWGSAGSRRRRRSRCRRTRAALRK
jgi:hypothetical protein